jgi:hypothetical protein
MKKFFAIVSFLIIGCTVEKAIESAPSAPSQIGGMGGVSGMGGLSGQGGALSNK